MARPHCHFITAVVDALYSLGLEYETIIIIPDNDEVGWKGAEKLHNRLLYDFDCCYMFDFNGAKDIREYIAKQSKQKVKQELLNVIQ